MARGARPVRGPRSALTSFLEERGIRNTNPAPVGSPRPANSESVESEISPESETQTVEVNVIDVTPEAQESVTTSETPEVSVPTYITRSRSQPSSSSQLRRGVIIDVSSEEEDFKKKKPASKKRGAGKKSKKDSDDDFEDESYSLNPKAHFTRRTLDDNSVGGVSFCSKCRRRFIVTSETPKNKGLVTCPRCVANPPITDGSFPAPKSQRQTKKRRRQNTLNADVDWFDSDSLPSLQRLCIQVICKHIDAVESFGDISIKSLTQISRILSKHRRLDDTTLPLFLNQSAPLVLLFDCARICEDSLNKITCFGRHLSELKLQFCGRMSDEILITLGKNLTSLNHFTLHGAFLVSENGFCNFFENIGKRLTYFTLQFSPRFSIKSMEAMLKYCPEIIKLTISSCEKLTDELIRLLIKEHSSKDSKENSSKVAVLPNLECLDISHPSPDVTDECLISVLPIIGSKITQLNLAGWKKLTDDGIICGIKEGCPNLNILDISNAENLTSEGLRILFEGLSKKHLPGSGLSELSLADCSILLDDSVLLSILTNNHRTLTNFSLNGLDAFSSIGIESAFTSFPPYRLTQLDVSWVRAMSDPLLDNILPLLPSLETLRVWGCHRVTETLVLPNRQDRSFYKSLPLNVPIASAPIKVIGRECDTL